MVSDVTSEPHFSNGMTDRTLARPRGPELLLALFAQAIQAQKNDKEVKPGAVELVRLENAWAKGLVNRDGALFEKLLAPKFVYTEDDKLMRREEVLKEVTKGSDTVTAALLEL
jgi:hypothetical protein